MHPAKHMPFSSPFQKKRTEYTDVSRTSLAGKRRKTDGAGVLSFGRRTIETGGRDTFEKILFLQANSMFFEAAA